MIVISLQHIWSSFKPVVEVFLPFSDIFPTSNQQLKVEQKESAESGAEGGADDPAAGEGTDPAANEG